MPRITPTARRVLTEERRKQILDAAAKVFAAKGFDRATIADIAREAGIAEGSIYNYFKNKEDLLVSIPRQVIQPPVESVSAQMHGFAAVPVPPEQMLMTIARNMISVVRQNVHIFRILVSALPTMSQETRDKYMNQVVMYAQRILEAYFREQIEQGVFRQGLEPRVLTRAFIGMFFPFVMLGEVLQVETEAGWDYDQLITKIVPLFLHGVLAQGDETSPTTREPKRTQKISIE